MLQLLRTNQVGSDMFPNQPLQYLDTLIGSHNASTSSNVTKSPSRGSLFIVVGKRNCDLRIMEMRQKSFAHLKKSIFTIPIILPSQKGFNTIYTIDYLKALQD